MLATCIPTCVRPCLVGNGGLEGGDDVELLQRGDAEALHHGPEPERRPCAVEDLLAVDDAVLAGEGTG